MDHLVFSVGEKMSAGQHLELGSGRKTLGSACSLSRVQLLVVLVLIDWVSSRSILHQGISVLLPTSSLSLTHNTFSFPVRQSGGFVTCFPPEKAQKLNTRDWGCSNGMVHPEVTPGWFAFSPESFSVPRWALWRDNRQPNKLRAEIAAAETAGTSFSTHSAREAKETGRDVSWGWWVRRARVRRSGCDGPRRETWTEGYCTNDLCENGSGDYFLQSVSLRAVLLTEMNLVLEAERGPSGGGWSGQCEESAPHFHH